MIIFYYVQKNKLDEILKSGIIISSQPEKSIRLNGEDKNCILGLLTPKDDIEKYNSNNYVLLELDIDPKRCFVLNNDYDLFSNRELYLNSAMLLKDYKYGTYRRPEVAITDDIDPKNILVPKKGMGSPFLVELSDRAYKDNLLEDLKLRYKDFNDTILSIFFMMMVSKGRIELLGQKQNGDKTIYIYKDKGSGNIYSLDIKER